MSGDIPDHETIVRCVAAGFDITVGELMEGRRQRRTRQIAMYLSHQLSRRSLSQIGARFWYTSSTNVLVAIYACRRRDGEEPEFAAMIERLKAAIMTTCVDRRGCRRLAEFAHATWSCPTS